MYDKGFGATSINKSGVGQTYSSILVDKEDFFNYRGSFETFTKRQQGGLIGRRNETRVMNTYSCEWDVVLREII